MDFGVGSQIPQSDVQVKGDGAIGVVKTEEYFKNAKVVMIAIPGAFTRPVRVNICRVLWSIMMLSRKRA